MPTKIVASLNKLSKGVEIIAHLAVLLRTQVSELQAANEAATRRKSHKRKRIQMEGTLTYEQGSQLVAKQEAKSQKKKGKRAKEGQASRSGQGKRHCGRCGEIGHNSRTCKVDIENTLE